MDAILPEGYWQIDNLTEKRDLDGEASWFQILEINKEPWR